MGNNGSNDGKKAGSFQQKAPSSRRRLTSKEKEKLPPNWPTDGERYAVHRPMPTHAIDQRHLDQATQSTEPVVRMDSGLQGDGPPPENGVKKPSQTREPPQFGAAKPTEPDGQGAAPPEDDPAVDEGAGDRGRGAASSTTGGGSGNRPKEVSEPPH